MKKTHKYESGQAIVEMTVGMVAVMVIVVGLLFVAAIGLESIEGAINVRSDAARQIVVGAPGTGNDGLPISEWDQGNDNLLYTPDDMAATTANENLHVYQDELDINKVNPDTQEAELLLFSQISQQAYIQHDQLDNLSGSLFVDMARLHKFSDVNFTPLRKYNLEHLEETYRALFHARGNVTVEDSFFMPDLD